MGIKNFFNKLVKRNSENPGKKKIIENGAIIITLGIVLIIAGGTIFETKETLTIISDEEDKSLRKVEISGETISSTELLEKRIGNILSKVDGAGKVEILITFISNAEKILAYDIKNNQSDTNEKDTEGGTREVKEKDTETTVVFEDYQGNNKKPIIVKELKPEVKGAVVICDGGNNSEVAERILNGVSVLLDLPAHKIKVYGRKIKQ